jgi:hypothetical protein
MERDFIDLATLSQRTQISPRALRYCVDHELAAEKTWVVSENEIGRPRTFDVRTGVYLACAYYLLEAGCKRSAIQELLRTIPRIRFPRKHKLLSPLINSVFEGSDPATFQLADQHFARLTAGKFDTGWIEINRPEKKSEQMLFPSNPRVFEISAKVVIGIDVGRIRDLVRGRP